MVIVYHNYLFKYLISLLMDATFSFSILGLKSVFQILPKTEFQLLFHIYYCSLLIFFFASLLLDLLQFYMHYRIILVWICNEVHLLWFWSLDEFERFRVAPMFIAHFRLVKCFHWNLFDRNVICLIMTLFPLEKTCFVPLRHCICCKYDM